MYDDCSSKPYPYSIYMFMSVSGGMYELVCNVCMYIRMYTRKNVKTKFMLYHESSTMPRRLVRIKPITQYSTCVLTTSV